MGVRQSIRAYNGVINWINKSRLDLGKPRNKSFRAMDEHLNEIFMEFGKLNSIEMEPNNSRGYKGTYSPVMSNCIRAQDNWSLYTKYMKSKYSIDKKKQVIKFM